MLPQGEDQLEATQRTGAESPSPKLHLEVTAASKQIGGGDWGEAETREQNSHHPARARPTACAPAVTPASVGPQTALENV